MLAAALAFFGSRRLAGLVLVGVTSWWLLAVGAAAIAGRLVLHRRQAPYGYAGFGEIAVFVFFGLVATAGTTFVLIGDVTAEAWFWRCRVGCIACAVLVVNNLRDIEQDAAAGKRTLSVRIGARGSRILFGVLMLVPYLVLGYLTLFYPRRRSCSSTVLLSGPAVLITATAKRPGSSCSR